MLARLADTHVATPPVRGDGSGLRYGAPGVSRAGPEVSEGSRCSVPGFGPLVSSQPREPYLRPRGCPLPASIFARWPRFACVPCSLIVRTGAGGGGRVLDGAFGPPGAAAEQMGRYLDQLAQAVDPREVRSGFGADFLASMIVFELGRPVGVCIT